MSTKDMESKQGGTSRMSAMPIAFQETGTAMGLRTKSGRIDLEKTAKTFVDKVDENKSQKKIIIGLSVAVALLIGSIFGVSIAAAYLAKDTYIDPSSGMMMAKQGSQKGAPIKTVEPLSKQSNIAVHELSKEQLFSLQKIVLDNSDTPVVFDVKGFARGPNATVLLVEGGTLSYSVDGGMEATGSALTLLVAAFGEEKFVENGPDGRKLWFGDDWSVSAVFYDGASWLYNFFFDEQSSVVDPSELGLSELEAGELEAGELEAGELEADLLRLSQIGQFGAAHSMELMEEREEILARLQEIDPSTLQELFGNRPELEYYLCVYGSNRKLRSPPAPPPCGNGR